MGGVHGRGPWAGSMGGVHGRGPWAGSMGGVHGRGHGWGRHLVEVLGVILNVVLVALLAAVDVRRGADVTERRLHADRAVVEAVPAEHVRAAARHQALAAEDRHHRALAAAVRADEEHALAAHKWLL